VSTEQDPAPQQALRQYLDRFKAALHRWERAVKNERRWFPRLEPKITELTESKLRSCRAAGLPPDPAEVTSLVLGSREQKLMQRIRQSRNDAEAEMRNACANMRDLCIRLGPDSRETLANLALLDGLSSYPALNSDGIIAFIERLTTPAAEGAGVPPRAAEPEEESRTAEEASPWQLSRWQDLEIRFLSDERVEVRAGERRETRNYAEMGFEDHRIGNQRTGNPTRAWLVLRAFATNEGRFPTTLGVREWRLIYKRVQEIKARLKERYECRGNPIPFVRGVGYVARFRVTVAPSSKY
jgi:hypothetical protein